MGIRIQFLPLIQAAIHGIANNRNVWMMGSQVCNFHGRACNKWLKENGYSSLPADWSRDPEPVFKALGFETYIDVDVNDAARRRLDLTQPLPGDCHEVADLVVDSGTLEHIFDARVALENMNRILRPGGVILHLSPLNFYEHGFVNFNPCFFNAFYAANGFATVFSSFQITIHNPFRIPRISPWMPQVLARFNLPINGERDWAKMLLRWSAVAPLPRNILYVGAYTKPASISEFRMPTDIWDEGNRFAHET